MFSSVETQLATLSLHCNPSLAWPGCVDIKVPPVKILSTKIHHKSYHHIKQSSEASFLSLESLESLESALVGQGRA